MPGHAVLCHPGRTSSSREWGCGAVFCCSPAAAWMELPGNCRVEARREQSGNCRDPRSSISARTPWAVRPSKGHGFTCCVPPSRCHHPSPELPQGRGFAGGWTRRRGLAPGRRGLAPAGLSRGCKVGLSALGMARMGAQHPAGAGQEDQPQASATSGPALPQNLPRNLPQHLPRHAGARSTLAGGGNGGVWQPPRPAHPARGATQPQGGARLGDLAPTPGLFPRCGGCRELGWGSGGGHPTAGDVPPVQGTLGRGSAMYPRDGMGELCGCAGGTGHGGVRQRGAVGLCPPVAVCDSGG